MFPQNILKEICAVGRYYYASARKALVSNDFQLRNTNLDSWFTNIVHLQAYNWVCVYSTIYECTRVISVLTRELVSADKQNKRGFGTGHIHRCSSHLRWGKHTCRAPSGNAVNDIQKARSQNGDWTDFMQDSP